MEKKKNVVRRFVKQGGGLIEKPKESLTTKVKKIVKKMDELKHYTINQVETPLFLGTNYNLVMTDVAQSAGASTDTTRIGDQITVTSLHIRWWLRSVPDLSVTPLGAFFRIIAYQYKPNNGLLAPVLSRLLVTGVSGGLDATSHQNVDYHNDYHILYDRTYTFAQLAQAAGAVGTFPDTGVRFGSFWIPMKKVFKKLQYDSGLLSHNNAIYLAAFSSTNAGAGITDPVFAVQTRLRFKDS